ncbi:hypothetical protein [Roseomonas genomospecies 6]|uniref:Uncharacterized protein n=1 Tax=Roseomonas genomospecies 6 TaxID=214106 RepID=A0A9W7KR44_9PROT|nr:hypothetical protein [Roseomonas genomospecies 6]KAA0678093.1 hypothetical protein DS843_21155 [Roseomonas genomospecies 6]
MADFYLRKGDPLDPVYEVDMEAGTWRLVASRIGVVAGVGGAMADGGARFRSADFERVYPKAESDNVVTYTTTAPTDANKAKLGCDYAGHEFGASYPDSMCIEGFLWDADSDDGDGMLTSGGDIPCPQCNHARWLEHIRDEVIEAGYEAAYDGKTADDCPFPAKARFAQDGEIFKAWWLQGHREHAAENASEPA